MPGSTAKETMLRLLVAKIRGRKCMLIIAILAACTDTWTGSNGM